LEVNHPGDCRWLICALLFGAATVNYIDRQVIGILKPTLVKEFKWSDERIYAAVAFSFQLAYAIGPNPPTQVAIGQRGGGGPTPHFHSHPSSDPLYWP
jgi:hypothetical protein